MFRRWYTLWCASVMLCFTGIGVQSMEIRPNILGGTNTTLGQVPFYGAMFRMIDMYIFCGGALIDIQWFLTAAHCVSRRSSGISNAAFGNPVDVNLFGLSFGDIDRNPDTFIGAKEIFIHEKFNSTGTMGNDIALVRLAENVTLYNNIQTVKIHSGQLKENDTLQVAGIGVVNLNPQTLPNTLQTINLPIASADFCQDVSADYDNPNGPRVCAGGVKGQDTCQGDSGGPLYKIMANNQTALVGVTSIGGSPNPTGPVCGDEHGVGFYTHAYYYIDWISEVTGIPEDSLVDKPQVEWRKICWKMYTSSVQV